MKKSLSLLACASVLLLGAGCSTATTSTVPAATTPTTTTQTTTTKTTTTPETDAKKQEVTTTKTTTTEETITQSVKFLTIKNFAYSPASITVKAGTMISWENSDSVAHTVTADDGSWDSGSLAKGKVFDRTFSKPGTYTYHCTPHPNMKGTIIVE